MSYRRSIFLINRPFQLRFSFFVCSWLFALSIVYPLIIYNLFDFFLRYLAVDPQGPAFGTLASMRKDIIVLLAVFQAVFLAITFLISIFISHRIAGPLFKLKRAMHEGLNGLKGEELTFRKTDHFKDLAAEFTALSRSIAAGHERTRSRVQESVQKLEKLSLQPGIGTSIELKEALLALRELQKN